MHLKFFLFISDLETKAGILLWKESWKESFTSGDRVCEWPTIRKTTTITTTATTTTTTTITIPSQRIGSHRCNTIVNPLKRWIIFCLTSWIFLFSDFKYSTRVICIYAVSFIGIYMVSLCRKTHGKNNFFSFYSTESLIFYNHYWVKTTRIRSVLAVLVSTAWLKRCFAILLHVLFFFDHRTLLNAEQVCVRLNIFWITSSLRAVFIFSVKSVRRAIPSTRQP